MASKAYEAKLLTIVNYRTARRAAPALPEKTKRIRTYSRKAQEQNRDEIADYLARNPTPPRYY